jgi:hypothetical protein
MQETTDLSSSLDNNHDSDSASTRDSQSGIDLADSPIEMTRPVRLSLYLEDSDLRKTMLISNKSANIDCDDCTVSTLGEPAPLNRVPSLTLESTPRSDSVQVMHNQACQSNLEAQFAMQTAQEMSQVVEWWETMNKQETIVECDSCQEDPLETMPKNTLTLEDDADELQDNDDDTLHTVQQFDVQDCEKSLTDLQTVLKDSLLETESRTVLSKLCTAFDSIKHRLQTPPVTPASSCDSTHSFYSLRNADDDSFVSLTNTWISENTGKTYKSAEEMYSIARDQRDRVNSICQRTIEMYQNLVSFNEEVTTPRNEPETPARRRSSIFMREIMSRHEMHLRWFRLRKRTQHAIMDWLYQVMPIEIVSVWLTLAQWTPLSIQRGLARWVFWASLVVVPYVALVMWQASRALEKSLDDYTDLMPAKGVYNPQLDCTSPPMVEEAVLPQEWML